MALSPETRYNGTIHRAKWTGYDKAGGGRGQALKYRVRVEGQGFADGSMHFSDAAAQKSYERIQEVIGKTFTKDEFLAFMRDPCPLLVGVPCSITTKVGDDGSVVVQWLNPDGLSGKPVSEEDEAAVLARLFPPDDPLTGADPWG